MVSRYQRDFPEACRCLLDDAEASLNHLSVPQRHQQYVRTSNLAERAFKEERRRTKVIPLGFLLVGCLGHCARLLMDLHPHEKCASLCPG